MESFSGASGRQRSATSAREVLAQLGRELAPVEQAIRTHRYLTAAPPSESLRAFAGEQYTVLRSDRRSFAHLAARYPEAPAGDFFLGLAQGEGEALVRLLAAWGEDCRRLASLLQGRCETSYFEFFAAPPPGFEELALSVADQGLAAGDSPDGARRAARLRRSTPGNQPEHACRRPSSPALTTSSTSGNPRGIAPDDPSGHPRRRRSEGRYHRSERRHEPSEGRHHRQSVGMSGQKVGITGQSVENQS